MLRPRGSRATRADRVIKPNVAFFEAGTWAGGAWHRSTVSEPPRELEFEPERREQRVGPVVRGGLVDPDRDLPAGAVLAVAHDGDVARIGADSSSIGIAVAQVEMDIAADGTAIIKVEDGEATAQIRIADGARFDPAGGIDLRLPTVLDLRRRLRRAAELWPIDSAETKKDADRESRTWSC